MEADRGRVAGCFSDRSFQPSEDMKKCSSHWELSRVYSSDFHASRMVGSSTQCPQWPHVQARHIWHSTASDFTMNSGATNSFSPKKKGNTPLVTRQAPCRRGSFRHFRTQKVWHFCWADTETNVFMPLQTRKGHFTQQHRKRQGKGLCHCESQNAPSLISQICHSCFGTIQYGIQLHLLQTHDLWFITSPWTCNGHRSFKLCDVGALQPTGLVETVANP